MNVKWWQIVCFLFIIVGTTIVVFPTQRMLLPLLIDNGLYGKAGATIDRLLKERPGDDAVVMEAVRLHLLEGDSDRAIERMEALNNIKGLTADQWTRLANLYTWNRNPAKAMLAWEAVIEKEPTNENALTQLVEGYRYQGNVMQEAAAIVRLIRMGHPSGIVLPKGAPFTALIAQELDGLGQHFDPTSPRSTTAMLISGLYQIYTEELSLEKTDADDRKNQMMTRCLEQYVWTGHLPRAETFAEKADEMMDTGVTRQLLLVDVMRWNQMNREALDLLQRLYEKEPGDRRVLVAMADVSETVGDKSVAITAYRGLVHLEPADPDHRYQLMALYRQTGRLDALFREFLSQFEATSDPKWLVALLTLSMESGEERLRERALAVAQKANSTDPAVIQGQADLHLAMNRPDLAYPLLKQRIVETKADADGLMNLIRVAGYTDDPAILADALSMAEAQMPKHPELLSTIASGWLAASQPQKAYATMRRLTAIKGNRSVDILATLEMAGHTGDPQTIGEAARWALRLRPTDTNVARRTLDIYLATGQTDRAYVVKARLIRQERSVEEVPALVRLAESTGQPELLADALATGLTLIPGDADLHLRLARLHLSQGQSQQAIEAFERYLNLRPDDESAQIQLAKLYEWEDRPHDALIIYRRLAMAHPDDVALSGEVLRMMAATGDREGLLTLNMKLADDDPQNADLALAAGRALVAEGRLEEGQGYLERAVALMPKRREIHEDLADVYAWTGQTDRLMNTLDYLDKTGDLAPHQEILLGEIYMANKRFADALALLKDLEKEPILPRKEGMMLAEAYEERHLVENARRIYERLFQENRKDPDFLSDLGERAQWRQHTDLALAMFEAALKNNPDQPKALKGSGQIYAWNNNHRLAIEALEAYNRIHPFDYEAQYLLGELYFATHREAEAQIQYRKAMKLINTAKTQMNLASPTDIGRRVHP